MLEKYMLMPDSHFLKFLWTLRLTFVKNVMSRAFTKKHVKGPSRVISISFIKSPSGFEPNLLLDFTGIDSPYEPPLNPHETMQTSEKSVIECTQQLVDLLVSQVGFRK